MQLLKAFTSLMLNHLTLFMFLSKLTCSVELVSFLDVMSHAQVTSCVPCSAFYIVLGTKPFIIQIITARSPRNHRKMTASITIQDCVQVLNLQKFLISKINKS